MNYSILFMIFGFIPKTIFAGNTLTFRKGNFSVSLKCPHRGAFVNEISSQSGSCKSTFCENGLFDYIKKRCDFISTCTLESKLLYSCRLPPEYKVPRYMNIYYTCWPIPSGRRYFRNEKLSSDRNGTIACNPKDHIEIDNLSSIYEKGHKGEDCIKDKLKDFCDRRHICYKERKLNSYLKNRKYINSCQGTTGPSSATNTQTLTMQPSTNHDIPDTDTADKIVSSTATKTQTLSVQQSTDHEKTNKDTTDPSTVINTHTINIQSSTYQETPDKDTAATIAGSTIAGILVVVLAVVAFCIRRKRFSANDSNNKNATLADETFQRCDFTGSQDVRMPNANQRAPNTFVYSVANDTCSGVTAAENGSDGFFVLVKENCSTNAMSDCRNYKYAIPLNEALDNTQRMTQRLRGENSTEGVYDQIASSNRKPDGEVLYGHSVDGVYDTMSGIRHDNNIDNLYSHSIDDIYDKTSHRKQYINSGNVYSHSVDNV